ncbi:hypothetical protein PIB30_000327 [Stylosanthes scabra]|uniref:Uncharacterized protein n=1 Tax=Stylosanthes scabra TaxID=79078 RepID=A0ABU6T294_9FABA|nr:hypothetical protein [Stylosanthes scabra]
MRLVKRMMVCTTTTTRDWQWVEDITAKYAEVVDIGEAGGAEERMIEDAKTWHFYNRVSCGASTSHAHEAGTSTQAEIPVTARNISTSDGYRPEFDDTQFNVDLNKLDSGPSQTFMALGSPPLAYMQGSSSEMSLPAPAHFPTPPASPAPTEHDDQPLAQGRGHKIPCRREKVQIGLQAREGSGSRARHIEEEADDVDRRLIRSLTSRVAIRDSPPIRVFHPNHNVDKESDGALTTIAMAKKKNQGLESPIIAKLLRSQSC